MKIISERRVEESVSYAHHFDYRESPGGGYAFNCTEDGEYIGDNPEGRENLRKCLAGEVDVVDKGILKYEHRYTHPAVGECEDCGAEVALGRFTCPCDCGADYNSSGQRLADRSQWGAETGEHWTECY